MPNIKIFVSHRIDLDSETIDNPIYVNVRCGAALDPRKGAAMPGDDTGDNISEKRGTLCELTVQYWAWKNVDAEYYGLCHYRRYLSFSQHRFSNTNEDNMIPAPVLTRNAAKKYGLLDRLEMERLVSGTDIVVAEYAPVENILAPLGKQTTVQGLWESYDGIFFEKSVITLMFELIDTFSPEYTKSARAYFAGKFHRGYNCYILKKELFDRLCSFQFPILFELERRLDTTGYTETMLRTPAFVGEMLYGIFIYHLTNCEQWRVKELQLVFFRDTRPVHGFVDLAARYCRGRLVQGLRAAMDPFAPRGSRRREALKRIYHAVKQWKITNLDKEL